MTLYTARGLPISITAMLKVRLGLSASPKRPSCFFLINAKQNSTRFIYSPLWIVRLTRFSFIFACSSSDTLKTISVPLNTGAVRLSSLIFKIPASFTILNVKLFERSFSHSTFMNTLFEPTPKRPSRDLSPSLLPILR